MKQIVGKPFFYYMPLIPEADNKILVSIMRIELHNVPENGLSTDFNHWFWLDSSLFRETGSEASGEDNNLHIIIDYIFSVRETIYMFL